MNFLKEKSTSIIMILLGIIAIIFPMVSTETIGIITGIVVILLAIAFIVTGITEFRASRIFGVVPIIFGILCLIFSYYLIAVPGFVSGLIGLIYFLFGALLIILGICSLFMGPIKIIGMITIIYGLISIIIGYFINDPNILGTVIGIWLLITGIATLFIENKV